MPDASIRKPFQRMHSTLIITEGLATNSNNYVRGCLMVYGDQLTHKDGPTPSKNNSKPNSQPKFNTGQQRQKKINQVCRATINYSKEIIHMDS